MDEETKEFYNNVKANIGNITKVVPYPVQNVVAKYEFRAFGKDHEVSVWTIRKLFPNLMENSPTGFLLSLLCKILHRISTLANI